MNSVEVVLGVDIGGTTTAAGYVDERGRILADTVIPTEADKPAEEFFRRLHESAEELFSAVKKKYTLVGVGLGAPNANYYKGTIEPPPNLSWGYVDVVKMLKQWYDVPVALTNDANAAAIGEMMFGSARGMKDFIVITLGTGLGSGIVSNGSLIYGHDGFAGEIGHTKIYPDGRQCGCGRKGCLEKYASATGICLTMQEILSNSKDPSELRKIESNKLTSRDIFNAAKNGDKLALEAFNRTGYYLGLQLADSIAYTSPEAIILFGGLALAGDLIFEPTKKYMEENLLEIFKGKVKLLPSGLKEGNTAVLGAAALVWNELKKDVMSSDYAGAMSPGSPRVSRKKSS